MTVYLHIGSHKTGTTAIQDFANNNRAWLEEQGIIYPSYDLIGGKLAQSHLGMVDDLIQADAERRAKATSMLAAAAEKASDRDVFLSAESLFRIGKDRAARICEVIRNAFGDTRYVVMCSLRPQAEFTESLYKNRFRVYARRPGSFDEWIAQPGSGFDYAPVVARYMDGLRAEPMLFAYSKETRDSFVTDFFARIGAATTQTPDSEVRIKNPSLDCVDCMMKDAILGDDCDQQMSKAVNNFCFKNPIRSEYGFLDRTREADFVARFSEGNRALIALEPALEPVLGNDVARIDLAPMDAAFDAMVRDRVEAFRASRR